MSPAPWGTLASLNKCANIGERCDIAESAQAGPNVTLGNNVSVGPNTVMLNNVHIEDDCYIGANCVLGEPAGAFYRKKEAEYSPGAVRICRGSILRSGTTVYEGVSIGVEFQGGTGIAIREDARIGDYCSIGTGSDIQFGAKIGDYSRLHSSVHITELADIGKYVWIMPNCVFTSDNLFPINARPAHPKIGPYSLIAANCLIFPGADLGMHVVVAAGSHVKGEHDEFSFIEGRPAERACDCRKYFTHMDGKILFPYPWPRKVERNYPWRDIPAEDRRLEDYL